MGYNTTVFILNDALHELEKHPEEFVQGIAHKMNDGGTVGVGNHCNPVEVMPTQHADVPRLYFSHQNWMSELSPYNKQTMDYIREGGWRADLIKNKVKQAEQILRDLKKAIKDIEDDAD